MTKLVHKTYHTLRRKIPKRHYHLLSNNLLVSQNTMIFKRLACFKYNKNCRKWRLYLNVVNLWTCIDWFKALYFIATTWVFPNWNIIYFKVLPNAVLKGLGNMFFEGQDKANNIYSFQGVRKLCEGRRRNFFL